VNQRHRDADVVPVGTVSALFSLGVLLGQHSRCADHYAAQGVMVEAVCAIAKPRNVIAPGV